MKISTHMAHLCAPNDYNGNPQRLYVRTAVVDGETTHRVWDEGYLGHHCVPESLRADAFFAERREISARTYRELLKSYGQ